MSLYDPPNFGADDDDTSREAGEFVKRNGDRIRSILGSVIWRDGRLIGVIRDELTLAAWRTGEYWGKEPRVLLAATRTVDRQLCAMQHLGLIEKSSMKREGVSGMDQTAYVLTDKGREWASQL